jgi:hypothetical protein
LLAAVSGGFFTVSLKIFIADYPDGVMLTVSDDQNGLHQIREIRERKEN